MKLTKQEVKHLADLSALYFSENELDSFAEEFETLTDFISQINKVDIVSDVIIDKTVDLEDLREDEVLEGLSNEEVLMNAPRKSKGAFSVPLIIE